jgi:hypothetical protein
MVLHAAELQLQLKQKAHPANSKYIIIDFMWRGMWHHRCIPRSTLKLLFLCWLLILAHGKV